MNTLLIGLSIGAQLFILASGITLLFGVMKIINFAHGAYYAFGAYIAFTFGAMKLSFWWAIPAAMLIGGALGAVQEVLTIRPIYRAKPAFQLLSTFGWGLIVLAVMRVAYGLEFKNVGIPPGLDAVVHVGEAAISVYRLAVIGLGGVMAALLIWIVDRTSLGVMFQAASTNSDMAECLGVNVRVLRTGILSVSAALAALAGAVAAPLSTVQLEMSQNILLDGFLIVTLGGLGSVKGTLVVAVIYGLCQAFGLLLVPSWVQFITYAVALLIFLARPHGIFFAQGRVA